MPIKYVTAPNAATDVQLLYHAGRPVERVYVVTAANAGVRVYQRPAALPTIGNVRYDRPPGGSGNGTLAWDVSGQVTGQRLMRVEPGGARSAVTLAPADRTAVVRNPVTPGRTRFEFHASNAHGTDSDSFDVEVDEAPEILSLTHDRTRTLDYAFTEEAHFTVRWSPGYPRPSSSIAVVDGLQARIDRRDLELELDGGLTEAPLAMIADRRTNAGRRSTIRVTLTNRAGTSSMEATVNW